MGGNPLLEGVWFFGNGMVCFKTSYDFFMIALEDQEEVQRMVKEIKGLAAASGGSKCNASLRVKKDSIFGSTNLAELTDLDPN